MRGVLADLRFALRTLARSPGFSAAAVLTLALGIGANTTVFTVVRAVLLASLPYPHAGRLVEVRETVGPEKPGGVSYPNYIDWLAENSVFDGMAAYAVREVTISGQEAARRVRAELVTPGYFDLLGAAAIQGRLFSPEENKTAEAHPVVVISAGLWQRHFGADPGAIGRAVTINGAVYTIIGVAEKRFEGYSGRVDIWLPITMHPALSPRLAQVDFLASRDIHWHRVLARLKPDIPLERAQAEMDTIAARLAAAYPQANAKRGVRITPVRESLTAELRPALIALFAAAGFVLLIACINVASLLMVRSWARTREIGVRVALGARQRRLVRQLMTESLALTLLGGSAGLLLAVWGTGFLKSALPLDLPSFASVKLDWTVLAFALGAVTATGLALGAAPALHAWRPDVVAALREGGRGNTGSVRTQRARRVLVAGEIALTVVVLAGAGLMLKSLERMHAARVGFDPERLLTMRVDIPGHKYPGDAALRLIRQLVERAGQTPGVERAAATTVDPFLLAGMNRGFTIEGQPTLPPAEQDSVFFHSVTPGYFSTINVPVLTGRDFTLADDADAPGVIIVSEAFSRRYWPGEDPIGRRLKYGPRDSTQSWLTVVGMVRDVRFRDLRQDVSAEPAVYVPIAQTSVVPSVSLVARAHAAPASVLESLRTGIREIEPEAPIYSASTFEERLAELRKMTKSYTLLLSAFALVALLLAAVGIYGVTAFSVTHRTQELGLRMALGARPTDVLVSVLRQGLLTTAAGLGLGLAAASALTRAFESLLYEVRAGDPGVLAAVSAVLACVALAATYAPARRVTKIDPLSALRYE